MTKVGRISVLESNGRDSVVTDVSRDKDSVLFILTEKSSRTARVCVRPCFSHMKQWEMDCFALILCILLIRVTVCGALMRGNYSIEYINNRKVQIFVTLKFEKICFENKTKHLLAHGNQCIIWISSWIICKLRSIKLLKTKVMSF